MPARLPRNERWAALPTPYQHAAMGAKESFALCLSFAAEDLEFFARVGVDIEVMGYPMSDED